MFIRFVVGSDGENAFWLTGIFVEARLLRDDDKLYAYEVEILNETFDWFNEYLPCPPFRSNLRSGAWTRDAVSWFRDDAKACINRICDLVHLLHENGVVVQRFTTDRPGKIVYADKYQIVAETPYWI